jgi:hypothetical protein
MTIGDPSCKKSPATKPIFTVFKEIEREDKAEYAKQRMVWEGKEIAFSIFLTILINNLIHPRHHLV